MQCSRSLSEVLCDWLQFTVALCDWHFRIKMSHTTTNYTPRACVQIRNMLERFKPIWSNDPLDQLARDRRVDCEGCRHNQRVAQPNLQAPAQQLLELVSQSVPDGTASRETLLRQILDLLRQLYGICCQAEEASVR